MIKNRILKLLLTCCLFFSVVLNVYAALTTDSNIYSKINNLKTLSQYNYIGLINKSELIGYRLDAFNIATSQYKNSVMLTLERLSNIPSQINAIQNSADISDSDKQVQINNLYNDADTALYNLDSQTMNYLYSLRSCMPSLTYRKYMKKFQEFYNSLQLTGSNVII